MRRVWKTILLILVGAIICACTHKGKMDRPMERDILFPFGSYEHEVDVQVDENESLSLRGVFQISEEKIQIVGLSPMNTTLFRLNEDRATKAIELEVYDKKLKEKEKTIRAVYGVLRPIFRMKRRPHKDDPLRWLDQNKEGFPTVVELQRGDETVEVHLSQYDEDSIPRRIELGLKEFALKINVVRVDT